jgi:serine/threonine-protein kinase
VVGDFGIAKALNAAAEMRSMSEAEPGVSSSVLGTPAYMAPEQVAGATQVDHRCDLYAFGVVAYELLAGVHPFAGRSPRAMVKAQLEEMPEPLDTIRPDLPPPLVSLVRRCLAKSPTERPDTADAVRALLDESLRQLDSPRRPRRRRGVMTGLAATGVLAVSAAAWLAVRPDRSLLNSGVLLAREPLVVADFQAAGADSGLGVTLGRMLGRYLGNHG